MLLSHNMDILSSEARMGFISAHTGSRSPLVSNAVDGEAGDDTTETSSAAEVVEIYGVERLGDSIAEGIEGSPEDANFRDR
jgi:hypothetical protein